VLGPGALHVDRTAKTSDDGIQEQRARTDLGADVRSIEPYGEEGIPVTGPPQCALSGSIELPHSPTFLFEAVLRSAPDANLMVTTVDRDTLMIRGRLPTTLFFWGPEVTLHVDRIGPEMALVRYEAGGTARRPGQEERFREYIRTRLSRLLRDAAVLLEPEHVGA
jgi:hypothetical protein